VSAPLGFELDDEHLRESEEDPGEDDGEPECDTCGDPASYLHPDGQRLCCFCTGFVREEYGVKCTPLADTDSCGPDTDSCGPDPGEGVCPW
jgi:hypothetical protein